MKICIDPGHSGPFEPGACAGGFTEAAINLQVSKRLRDTLESNGYDVFLTRESTVNNDGLTWRAEKAEDFGADIFVSIHCNSFRDPAAHGTEVIYYVNSELGRKLAQHIQTALVDNCGTTDRGIKTNDEYTVLEKTVCPAVLVELAFLSNDEEREALTDRFIQKTFAVGIAKGIDAYFEDCASQ
jgi:N-acetylmuramoyl-L-alanine amidase